MKRKALLVVVPVGVLVTSIAAAQEQQALSTSGFVELSYKDEKGVTTKTCFGKKAAFGQSYVSVGIDKLCPGQVFSNTPIGNQLLKLAQTQV